MKQSVKQMQGGAIVARDGALGEVEDFVVDPQTWKLKAAARRPNGL